MHGQHRTGAWPRQTRHTHLVPNVAPAHPDTAHTWCRTLLERLVVDFEELGHLREPALLHEADVIRMLVVGLVRGRSCELHRDAVPVAVLRARLVEDLERFDAGNLREACGGREERGFLLRAGRMR